MGGTPEQLTELIETTPIRSPEPCDGLPTERLQVEPPGDPFTNATIFVEHTFTHIERPLIAYQGGFFYHWDGTCWPELLVEQLRSQLYKFFDPCCYRTRDGLVGFWPTAAKVNNLVDALRAFAQLGDGTPAPAWLNPAVEQASPHEIIACQNGLLHVPTRALLPHTPLFYVHHAVPFAYASDAPTPKRWLRFLNELWDHDNEAKDTLQEILGYLLVGDTHLQKMFLLVGPPRSGKSTIGRVIHGLVGSNNVAGPTLASLATNFGLASLVNRPVALIADARLRTGQDVVTERLLSISGEDMLTVDRKYKEPWIGTIPSRIVIFTNELPRLGDMSGALAARFIVLQFTRSFLGNEDPHLTRDLRGELPGIFNWALDGLDRLAERGYFVQPESSRGTMQELEDLGSPMKAFLNECCERVPDAVVSIDTIYRAYERWCNHTGHHASATHAFGRDLRAVIPDLQVRQSKKPPHRHYVGIRLRSEYDFSSA